MSSLFDLPSNRFAKYYKYDENQPRAADGKWTAAGAAGAAAAGLVGAAAAGVPVARSIVPGVRRAVIAARIRAARQAVRPSAVIGRADINQRSYQRGDLKDNANILGLLLSSGRDRRINIKDVYTSVGRQMSRDVAHSSSMLGRGALGALSARGKERALVNATRHQLNQFSAASRRRASRRGKK